MTIEGDWLAHVGFLCLVRSLGLLIGLSVVDAKEEEDDERMGRVFIK